MSFTFPSRLLGELLVERGLIGPADLEDALAEQRATGRRLGEVLVSRGALAGAELTRALAEQYGIELSAVTVSALESSEPPAPWQPLGRLLVTRGAISQDALDEALATQRRSGRKLGDVLVSEHGVSMLKLAAALSEQHGLAVGADSAARAGHLELPGRVVLRGQGARPSRALLDRQLSRGDRLRFRVPLRRVAGRAGDHPAARKRTRARVGVRPARGTGRRRRFHRHVRLRSERLDRAEVLTRLEA